MHITFKRHFRKLFDLHVKYDRAHPLDEYQNRNEKQNINATIWGAYWFICQFSYLCSRWETEAPSFLIILFVSPAVNVTSVLSRDFVGKLFIC